jgi:hypothetical protein
MLKLSTMLVEMATIVAGNMLEKGLQEAEIPGTPSYRLSLADSCPEGHIRLGNITVGDVIFYISQKF